MRVFCLGTKNRTYYKSCASPAVNTIWCRQIRSKWYNSHHEDAWIMKCPLFIIQNKCYVKCNQAPASTKIIENMRIFVGPQLHVLSLRDCFHTARWQRNFVNVTHVRKILIRTATAHNEVIQSSGDGEKTFQPQLNMHQQLAIRYSVCDTFSLYLCRKRVHANFMLLGNMEIRIQLFVAIYDAAWGNALLVDIFNRMSKRFI